jgi:hypothetical protein
MSAGFDISNLQDSSVLTLNDMRDRIMIDPEYQREGSVWTLSKKQLFIDSLLNKYDVPKIYFHNLLNSSDEKRYDYAIIDGRQRLETIWDFLDNKFSLDAEFKFIEDESTQIGGLYFKDIIKSYPRIATRLYGRSLMIMIVRTSDIDFIEDMFTRLNEAVPLNAAEKRNSFGGPLPQMTRELVKHQFFLKNLKVSATRYRHHDLVAKMLWIAYAIPKLKTIPDTKKVTLDNFYRSGRLMGVNELDVLSKDVRQTLDLMSEQFGETDYLLKSASVVPVYFALYHQSRKLKFHALLSRQDLALFEEKREENRRRFQAEDENVDFKLIEYDELAQSSNDGASISARIETLREFLGLPHLNIGRLL